MVFGRFSPYSADQPGWRQHVCGLYYSFLQQGVRQKTYLPPVELQAHATILDTTSRTVLTQTFVNPSSEKGIREVRYTFPLYDGVSVVGFTCHVGDRTITGEVKEKEKAKAVFKEAVARGETAGLLEQLPEAADVFTTTVGNIPPGAKVVVQITYLGELKHDMETDGIRFTIPNVICPRYGEYPGTLYNTSAIDAMGGNISIIVDAEMADGSFIQRMQSPSHPISMNMGTISSAPNADPVMTKASASLSLGSAQLDTDFILQVIAKNTGVPKAVLENHPTIPNQRALMTTLVPKFSLPAEKPEIVFVCDRSGSMAGSRITLVVQALKVFLKSLPVGVKFNICSFGNSHSFLWQKSVTYDQSTLDQAIGHVGTFSANYGGTEMLEPLKATIERRYKDIPLDIMVLTDGEIWNQQDLFAYLNQSVKESSAPIRLFTLGIGNGVSHALIEGIAKAGDGFSQSVGEGEKMDTKVVRMLKGALSPHINDYTLEVKYSGKASTVEDDDDDFEIIEKVTDSLKVHLDIGEEKKEQKKPISLFDTSVDLDREEPQIADETGEGRYTYLPKIVAPKMIQAPQNIPSLFAFNRTTAYLLLGPEAPKGNPKSVVLRGTSAHGPLELEIPVRVLDSPGETIHQLAAKKAISELEQGRGWLPEAKDDSDILIKSKFEGRFDDMVEREAVRLGVQFQVGGKWCSFVAVESSKKLKEEKEKATEKWDWLEDEQPIPIYSTGTTLHESPSPYSRRSRWSHLVDVEGEVIEEDDEESEEEQGIDYEGEAVEMDEDEEDNDDDGKGSTPSDDLADEIRDIKELAADMFEEDETQEAYRDRTTYLSDNPDDLAITRKRLERLENTDTNESPDLPQKKRKSVKGLLLSKSTTPNQGPPMQQMQNSMPSLDMYQAQQQQQQQQQGSLFGAHKSSRGNAGYGASSLTPWSYTPPTRANYTGPSLPSGPGGQLPMATGFFNSNSGAAPTSSLSTFAPQSSMVARGTTASGSAEDETLEEYQTSLMMLRQEKKSQIGGQPTPSFGVPSQSSPGSAGANSTLNLHNDHISFQTGQLKIAGYRELEGDSPQSQAASAFGGFTRSATSGNPFKSAAPASGSGFASTGGSFLGSTTGGNPFRSAAPGQATAQLFGQPKSPQGAPSAFNSLLGSAQQPPAPVPTGNSLFGGPASGGSLFASSASAQRPGVFGQSRGSSPAAGNIFASAPPAPPAPPALMKAKTPEDLVHHLIGLQTFEGSWEDTSSLLALLDITEHALMTGASKAAIDKKLYVTALVVAMLEHKLQDFKGSWELVVDKARGWLADQGISDVDGLVLQAKVLVK